MSPEQHAEAARTHISRIKAVTFLVRVHEPVVAKAIFQLCEQAAKHVEGPMPVIRFPCAHAECLIPQAITSTYGVLTHVGLARPDVDANSLATLCLTIGVLLARLKIEASIDGRINVSRRGAA